MVGASLTFGVAVGLTDDVLAVRAGMAVAGFCGGLISLGFKQYPNAFQTAIAVFAGVVGGIFIAPILMKLLELGPTEGFGIALGLGLVAMPLFGGAHRLAELWRSNPVEILNVLRGRGKDRDP